ncbi:hypothetical protein M899_0116 [Bacteriovorax sp. BSW11_IV]|uniref:hypothetical protein n=1 Tax=Bacteriovorax sp. BSW11_IV TaxID=1353529 RepID=UPI000389F774|nr:hypothetical protein [Bacteriovorax sp. BSW11_IV]EQC47000.1 hypothetical protein M899_0116 [Bacteriovorax sp. BSW11_IV]
MYKVILLNFLILISSFSWAQDSARNQIEQFDLTYYHPENFGLRDLTFEIRIENLLEQLNANKTLGKLEDVYFKIFWIFPGQYHIEVNGLPNGFNEIKQQLRNLIKPRLDFVIPQKLLDGVRSYDLSMSKSGNVNIVKAEDKTHTRQVNEIQLKFEENGKMIEYKTSSPVGVSTTTFEQSKKNWSHNKWVADKIIVESIQGIQIGKVISSITYLNEGGFGLPEKVEIVTKHEIVAPEKDKKVRKNIAEDKIIYKFSKYMVNTGSAKKEILKGQ